MEGTWWAVVAGLGKLNRSVGRLGSGPRIVGRQRQVPGFSPTGGGRGLATGLKHISCGGYGRSPIPSSACPDCLGLRHPQGVPQARQEAPSRSQPRRQGGRGEVQGHLAGQPESCPMREEAPPLRCRRDRRDRPGGAARAASTATSRGFAAPSTSVPAPTNPSSTWAASFPRCSGRGAAAAASLRSGDGEDVDMAACRSPTPQGAVPGGRARRGKQRVTCPTADADIDVPEGTTDGTTACGSRARACPAARAARRDAYVGSTSTAPVLRAARQRHPCRAAGDAHRGGAGWPDPRADGGRARHC